MLAPRPNRGFSSDSRSSLCSCTVEFGGCIFSVDIIGVAVESACAFIRIVTSVYSWWRPGIRARSVARKRR